MILRPVASGSKAATVHLTKPTPSGLAEENGRKWPQKRDFFWQMSFVTGSRRPITLLEVLLVMVILSIAMGAVAINVARSIHSQRFRSEVDLFVDQLRLVQNLMLICRGNIEVVLTATDQGINSRLDFPVKLPKEYDALVIRSELLLTNIHAIDFQDQQPFSKIAEKQNEQHLRFFSNGDVMSRGIMRLASSNKRGSKDQVFERYLCLPGFPAKISSFATLDEAETHLKNMESHWGKALTQQTFEELREKDKAS